MVSNHFSTKKSRSIKQQYKFFTAEKPAHPTQNKYVTHWPKLILADQTSRHVENPIFDPWLRPVPFSLCGAIGHLSRGLSCPEVGQSVIQFFTRTTNGKHQHRSLQGCVRRHFKGLTVDLDTRMLFRWCLIRGGWAVLIFRVTVLLQARGISMLIFTLFCKPRR